jgi:hypothetical protein
MNNPYFNLRSGKIFCDSIHHAERPTLSPIIGSVIEELSSKSSSPDLATGDHYHHLLFVLCWLNDGLFYRAREADTGYSKSSIQEDLIHVLQAIIEGLDEHLTWPDDNHRRELALVYTGILRGCIGVGDVKEYEIEKPKDSVKEKRSC